MLHRKETGIEEREREREREIERALHVDAARDTSSRTYPDST